MADTDGLNRARQAVCRLKAINVKIEQAKVYREALERKVKALKDCAFEEEIDVDSIKENKAYSLLLSLRGKLEERMDKEESEVLAVKLLLEQTKKELAALIIRIDALSRERAALSCSETEYERLYDMRRQALILEGNDNSSIVKSLSDDVSRAKTEFDQICCTLGTGEKLIAVLKSITENLDKAEEVVYMRGVESLLSREDYIDAAKGHANEAQKLFYEFKAQASSTRLSKDALATSGFVALEVLCDGIIAARFSMDRTGKSKVRAAAVLSEVLCDVLKLKQMHTETQNSLESLTKQLDELVLGTLET